MKNFFILVLSFVFVVQIYGQGNIGRRQGKGPIKPVIGHPVMPKPIKSGGFDSSLGGLHGGGFRAAESGWRNHHIGNSIHGGNAIRGRQTGFPNHRGEGVLAIKPSKADTGMAWAAIFAFQCQGYIGRQRKPAKAAIVGGHDPLAVRGGHRIVKNVLNDAAHTIDAGSHGALSRGDPFAHQAAEGLAREMVHVAGKKLGVAPGVRPFGQGIQHRPLHQVHQPIHPQPKHKPVYPKPVQQKRFIPVQQPIYPKPINKLIHPKPIGRVHKPIHPKPIHPKSIHPKPHHPKPIGVRGGGLRHLQGGGRRRLPLWVRNLIGRTISGDNIVGGQGGFPRHGGAGIGESFKDGMRNGWGADPNAPVHQAVSSWVDPLDGNLFPTQYQGEELRYDDKTGHYVIKSQAGRAGAVGHQMAKATGIAPIGARKIGPIGGHQMAKATGIAPIGSGKIGPIGGHQMAKATGIAPIGQSFGPIEQGFGPIEQGFGPNLGVGPIGQGFDSIGHGFGPIDKQVGHQMAKATGIAPIGRGKIGPIGGHQIAKATGIAPIRQGFGSMEQGFGPIGQGFGPIGQGFGPIDQQVGHQMAKATGIAPIGSGKIGPIGGHQIAKATGIAPIGQGFGPIDQGFGPIDQGFGPMDQGFGPIDQGFGPIGQGFGPIDPNFGRVDPVHNIAKSGTHMGLSSLQSLGKPLGGTPIHNVHKVAKSGVLAANHDPLAVGIGHQTAKHIANKATNTINMATGGGVHRGDPFATNAAHGLAREAAAVTNEQLSLASGGARPFGPVAGIQSGVTIHRGRPGKPFLPKKKPVQHIQPFPTGYGRQRKRKVVAARSW